VVGHRVSFCMFCVFLVVSFSVLDCLEILVSEIAYYVLSGILNFNNNNNNENFCGAIRCKNRFKIAKNRLKCRL